MIEWTFRIQYWISTLRAYQGPGIANFVVELTINSHSSSEEDIWTLYVDGTSNMKANGARVILDYKKGITI